MGGSSLSSLSLSTTLFHSVFLASLNWFPFTFIQSEFSDLQVSDETEQI